MGSGKIDFSIILGRDFTHFSKFLFGEGGKVGKYTKQHNKNQLNRNQTTLILNGKGYAFVRALQILNTPLTLIFIDKIPKFAHFYKH